MKVKKEIKRILAVFLALTMVVIGLYIVKPEAEEAKASETSSQITVNTPDQVADGMLDIKVQMRMNDNDTKEDLEDDTMDLRLVSSVNGLGYASVGFEVYFGEAATDPTEENCIDFVTSIVLEEIHAVNTGVEYNYSPKIISPESEYFITGTIMGVAYKNWEENFYIRSFVIPIGSSERVYGVDRFFNVQDAKDDAIVNIPVKMETEPVDKNISVTIAGETTTAEVVHYTQGYAHLNVNVPANATQKGEANKVLLPSATVIAVNENESAIYRNSVSNYAQNGADESVFEVYKDTKKFVIATDADLYGFAAYSADYNFEGDQIFLAADIASNQPEEGKNLTSYADWIAYEASNTPIVWNGIGADDDFRFAGKFYGEGHTIRGVYANGRRWQGLFSQITTGAVIENFKLVDSCIVNEYQSGSVVGRSYGGTITDVYSNAIVKGNEATNGQQSGGIVGRAMEGTTLTLTRCWYDGTIYGNELIGGLIGETRVQTNLADCLFTGISGTLNADSQGKIGGFIGSNEAKSVDIKCSLSKGQVVVPDESTISDVNTVVGKETAVTKTAVYTEETGGALYQGISAYQNASELDWKETWITVKDAKPVLRVFATEAAGICADISWLDDSDGLGEETAYILKDKADLWGFSEYSQTDSFSDKFIRLTEDVVLNQNTPTTYDEWKVYDKTALEIWKPIGSSTSFAGTFDGAGHSISGLYTSGTTKVGLFGKAVTGSAVKNLKLLNSYIAGQYQFGAVVGTGASNLSNIYTNAVVTSDGSQANAGRECGGILGWCIENPSTFINCWFDGYLYGATIIGGITGRVASAATGTTLTNCLSTGIVVSDLLVADNNDDTTYMIGGMIGYIISGASVTFTDCLTVATITVKETTATRIGSLVGRQAGTATCTDVYVSAVQYSVFGVGQAATGSSVTRLNEESQLIGDTLKASTLDLPWDTVYTLNATTRKPELIFNY